MLCLVLRFAQSLLSAGDSVNLVNNVLCDVLVGVIVFSDDTVIAHVDGESVGVPI